MTPNAENLSSLFTSYNATLNKAKTAAPSFYKKLSMVVPSTTRENQYGWLGAMPNLREWVGDRIIHQLSIEGFVLRNKEFEATVAVRRTDVEDDQYGVYGPMFEKMGHDAAQHPHELVLALLRDGFTRICYDNQYFFDTDHPVGGQGEAPIVSVNNSGGGSGTPWYLLDCSQPLKPLVFQERLPYKLTSLDREQDEGVFSRGEYLYGVRARGNAGFGLWQLAFGSKQTLSGTNYAAARAAMMAFKSDSGKVLNITPTHLVVPPSLEEGARQIVVADRDAGGAANVWHDSAGTDRDRDGDLKAIAEAP